MILNRLCTLSPFQGLVLLMFLYRGFFPSVRRRRTTPPSVVYRAFGAYLPDTNNLFCKRKSYHKHLPATVSLLLTRSTRAYRDKYVYLFAEVHVLIRRSTRTYSRKYTYLFTEVPVPNSQTSCTCLCTPLLLRLSGPDIEILLSGEKHRTKGRRSQGAKDHRRGW